MPPKRRNIQPVPSQTKSKKTPTPDIYQQFKKAVVNDDPLQLTKLYEAYDIDLSRPLFGSRASFANGAKPYPISAMHFAAGMDCFNVLQTLLKLGVNANSLDLFGCTPLHTAAISNNARIATILLSQPSIDINILNKEQRSALQLAIGQNSVSIAKILLARREIKLNVPDVYNVKDQKTMIGNSAVSSEVALATLHENEEIFDLIIEHPSYLATPSDLALSARTSNLRFFNKLLTKTGSWDVSKLHALFIFFDMYYEQLKEEVTSRFVSAQPSDIQPLIARSKQQSSYFTSYKLIKNTIYDHFKQLLGEKVFIDAIVTCLWSHRGEAHLAKSLLANIDDPGFKIVIQSLACIGFPSSLHNHSRTNPKNIEALFLRIVKNGSQVATIKKLFSLFGSSYELFRERILASRIEFHDLIGIFDSMFTPAPVIEHPESPTGHEMLLDNEDAASIASPMMRSTRANPIQIARHYLAQLAIEPASGVTPSFETQSTSQEQAKSQRTSASRAAKRPSDSKTMYNLFVKNEENVRRLIVKDEKDTFEEIKKNKTKESIVFKLTEHGICRFVNYGPYNQLLAKLQALNGGSSNFILYFKTVISLPALELIQYTAPALEEHVKSNCMEFLTSKNINFEKYCSDVLEILHFWGLAKIYSENFTLTENFYGLRNRSETKMDILKSTVALLDDALLSKNKQKIQQLDAELENYSDDIIETSSLIDDYEIFSDCTLKLAIDQETEEQALRAQCQTTQRFLDAEFFGKGLPADGLEFNFKPFVLERYFGHGNVNCTREQGTGAQVLNSNAAWQLRGDFEVDLLRDRFGHPQIVEQKRQPQAGLTHSQTIWDEGLKFLKAKLILEEAIFQAKELKNYELLYEIDVKPSKGKKCEFSGLTIPDKLKLFELFCSLSHWKIRFGNHASDSLSVDNEAHKQILYMVMLNHLSNKLSNPGTAVKLTAAYNRQAANPDINFGASAAAPRPVR